MQYILKKNSLVCEICGKEFFLEKSFKYHLLTHNAKKLHTCEICKKGFNYKTKLKEHLRVHTKERPFVCDVCYVSFATKKGLNSHVHTIHSKKSKVKKNSL